MHAVLPVMLPHVPAASGRCRTSMDAFVPLDWQQAVSCGVCRDRAEYLAMLQKVCIAGSEQAVREQYAAKDVELLQMVRTLDEMDTVVNVLSERVADWYQIRHPSFSRKYRRTPAHVLVKSISERNRERGGGGGALGKVATEITCLADARTALAKEVSARACEVMPNTSALIGGLVAARLLSHAGGLKELSRLPASGIQVLGARTALFAHIRTHAPVTQARDHLPAPAGAQRPPRGAGKSRPGACRETGDCGTAGLLPGLCGASIP